jgi:hypothetical protein
LRIDDFQFMSEILISSFFFQFSPLANLSSHRELLKDFIQDVPVTFLVRNENSVGAVPRRIAVPTQIPISMIVAVRTPKDCVDRYWIARVEDVISENPLKYRLRYFQISKQSKSWQLMKGNTAYGTVSHAGILTAGIQFNNNQTVKASSANQIDLALAED